LAHCNSRPALAEAIALAQDFAQRYVTATILIPCRAGVKVTYQLLSASPAISGAKTTTRSAGMTLPWRTRVEGQINRLKMLKRQMYGRAAIDLLFPTIPTGEFKRWKLPGTVAV